MAEQLDLTTPIAPPTRTFYRVTLLTLDWLNQSIRIGLLGSDGTEINTGYEGTLAVAFMTMLNTANLTTNSLHKRILNRLVVDGKLPTGSVTGTPQ